MKKPVAITTGGQGSPPSNELDVIDFSDVRELEEAIAPVFVAAFSPDSGGVCTKYGCICFGPK